MLPVDAKSYFRWIYGGFVCLMLLATASGFVFPSIRPAEHLGMVVDLFVAMLGGWLLVYGFSLLREKRLIENVPRSTVRSVAMGFAEISGAAREKGPLTAPLSGLPCVYFRYVIEEERSNGRNGREWVTIDQGESPVPFYVEDETGSMLVDPAGAETVIKVGYQTVRRDEGLFSKRKRYTEWHIITGERICVVGTVREAHDMVRERQARLNERLHDLKKDPQALARFDTDKNGQISSEEWDGAVRAVKDEMLHEEVRREPGKPEDEIVIGKGRDETTFVISDRSGASLVRGLAIKSGLSLLFGPAIVVIMAASLLARMGVIARGWAIHWESIF